MLTRPTFNGTPNLNIRPMIQTVSVQIDLAISIIRICGDDLVTEKSENRVIYDVRKFQNDEIDEIVLSNT